MTISRRKFPVFTSEGGPGKSYPWSIADVSAVKALAAGIADEEQQLRVLDLICKVSGTREQEVYIGDHDATMFAGGKRFVGQQFVWAATMNKDEYNKPTKEKKK